MFDYELPEGYKEAIYAETDIFLDWRDRIKALLGYRLTLKYRIATRENPEAHQTNIIIATRLYLGNHTVKFVTGDAKAEAGGK